MRKAAIAALVAINQPPTKADLRELVQALTSTAPEARVFSATALGRIGPDARGDATAALIGFSVQANKLAEADLVGLYGR